MTDTGATLPTQPTQPIPTPQQSLSARVLAASAGRDRVLDFAKVAALALVVIGHQLAWTGLPAGGVVNTLDQAPGLWWVTWLLQWLPIFFFAAGAGLGRSASRPYPAYLSTRIVRLVAPAIPLIVLTMILSTVLAMTQGQAIALAAGLLPVQLVWFLGVYLLIVTMAPLLRRMTSPWWLLLGLVIVLAVDLMRLDLNPGLGWINLIVVWALFAVAGVQAPLWRQASGQLLLLLAVILLALAVVAIWIGPYSSALISTVQIQGESNLAPPTIVLALIGLAQICLLLAAWNRLARWLSRDRLWVPVAVIASRSMGIYLWHMLLVTVVVGVVSRFSLAPAALSAGWWGLHVVAGIVVIGLAWVVAGLTRSWGEGLAGLLSGLLGTLPRPLPSPLSLVVSLLAAIALLGTAELGTYPALLDRSLLGFVPFVPAVGLAILLLAVALTPTRGAATRLPGTGP